MDDPASLVPKLVDKISSQAIELGQLEAQIASHFSTNVLSNDVSREKRTQESDRLNSPLDLDDYDFDIEPRLFDPLMATSTSSAYYKKNTIGQSSSQQSAQKRTERELNLQIVNLQKKLATAEDKLVEQTKVKNKILQDLDSKTRESKFLEKLCMEKESEIQSLKAKLVDANVSLRVSTPAGKMLRSSSATPRRSGSYSKTTALQEKNNSITYPVETRETDKNLRVHLEKVRKVLENSKESENQLRIQVKILEDALDFRSVEVGLSGQADLLAKVAKLKGEVTALRNELSDREKRLEEVEDVKLNLNTRHELLQKQISMMQKRLAQSQQDTYKLANGDIRELLRSTEEERDKLLKYVEADMQKSSTLMKQVEKLENELRQCKARSFNQQDLEATLDEQVERVRQLEAEIGLLSSKEIDSTNAATRLQMEKAHLEKQLDRKTLECEELSKSHLNKFSQIKDKEEEILNKLEEVNGLKSRRDEIESQLRTVTVENESLRHRLKLSEVENRDMRERLLSMEPRLLNIEPEFNRLREDKDRWTQEKVLIESETRQARQTLRLLNDMIVDIERTNQSIVSSTSGAMETAAVQSQQLFSRYQKHAKWVNLTSIRNVSPLLSDNLRELLAQLNEVETENSSLDAALTALRKDSAERESNLSESLEKMGSTVSHLRGRLKAAELDLDSCKMAKVILDRVRVVLKALPVDLTREWDMDDRIRPAHRNSSPGKRIGFAESKVLEDNHVFSDKEFFEERWRNVPDTRIPELVNKALVMNQEAVLGYDEVSFKLSQVQEDFKSLQRQFKDVMREKSHLESSLETVSDRLSRREERLQKNGEEYHEDLEAAAELAEKQNALAMTLEAKMEGLQRDRQLKAAQITALQQREEAMRKKLQLSLQNYTEAVNNAAVPPRSTKLSDLIYFTEDLLAKLSLHQVESKRERKSSCTRRHGTVAKTVDSLDSAIDGSHGGIGRDLKSSSLSSQSSSSPTTAEGDHLDVHSLRLAPSSSKPAVVAARSRRSSQPIDWDAYDSSPLVDSQRAQRHLRTVSSPVSTKVGLSKSRHSVDKKVEKRHSSLSSPFSKESSNNNHSNPFQARLLKAQLAFAALKESQAD